MAHGLEPLCTPPRDRPAWTPLCRTAGQRNRRPPQTSDLSSADLSLSSRLTRTGGTSAGAVRGIGLFTPQCGRWPFIAALSGFHLQHPLHRQDWCRAIPGCGPARGDGLEPPYMDYSPIAFIPHTMPLIWRRGRDLNPHTLSGYCRFSKPVPYQLGLPLRVRVYSPPPPILSSPLLIR